MHAPYTSPGGDHCNWPSPLLADGDFEMAIPPGKIVEELHDHPTNHPLQSPVSDVSVYRLNERGQRELLPDPYHRDRDKYYDHPRSRYWLYVTVPLGPILAILLYLKFRKKHGRTSSEGA